MKTFMQLILVVLITVGVPSISRADPSYTWSTLAGHPGGPGSVDGPAGIARFLLPEGVAVDNAGNVYVADTGNHIIRKITTDGMVTTLAGNTAKNDSGDIVGGYTDGPGNTARFGGFNQYGGPTGLAVDSAGNVYAADPGNNAIRKITPAGVVSTLANSYPLIDAPADVAVDSAGNLYVANPDNHRISKITPNGIVSTLAGGVGENGQNNAGSADGVGSAARFGAPHGETVDDSGNVYVADTGNNTIRKITPAGVVSTLAGTASTRGGYTNATGPAAQFNRPTGVTVDSAGNVYVADTGNQNIRKITPDGVVSTLASNVFYEPYSVAVDSAGNVYVADTFNQAIRKITPAGMVSILAGNPSITDADGVPAGGYADGTGSKARFSFPSGVTVDGAGNVYVADDGNEVIRKVTPAGVVTTLAGSPGKQGSADGTGRAAQFDGPSGVAVDNAGNVYVAERNNLVIRKVTSAGVVTTIGGLANHGGTVDGIGSSARFSHPESIAVDSAGTLYVADTIAARISTGTPGLPQPMASPIITPNGGTFTNSVKVLLSFDTAGAALHYTTDETEPTSRSVTYKIVGITITNSVTLTVKAFTKDLADSGIATAIFTIIIPPPPIITTTSLEDAIAKEPYTATLQVTPGTGWGPFNWTLAPKSKLPAGLKLNAKTGIISGKPTKTGQFNVTVKVTDAKKQTGTQLLTLTITN